MKATDLSKLQSVSAPTLHPSGDRAVVSVTRPDLDLDAYVGELWTVPLDGTAPRRLTRGRRDTAPAFSPDGLLLAFLRSEGDDPAQLWIMDAAGGEPRRLTAQLLGVTDFRWHPSSATLVFASRVPEPGRYGSDAGISAAAEPPRRYTGLRYRSNGLGFHLDRPTHLFVVEAASPSDEPDYTDGRAVPTSRQLTTDPRSAGPFVVTDDTVIAVYDARDELDLSSRLVAIAIADGQTGVRDTDVAISALTTAGSALYVIGSEVGESRRDFVGRGESLSVVESDGLRRITDPEHVDLGETGGALRLDGGSVLAIERYRGENRLLRIDPDTGSIERMTPDGLEVTGVDTADGCTVVSYRDATSFGEVAVTTGGFRRLTRFSAPLQATGISTPRELVVDARDGSAVHGWIVRPSGDGPHPVILMIHGGPFSQYTASVFDEAQVLADAGYAVVMGNPRGSAGYGEAHGRAIRQAMGTVDMTDVLDLLEGAIAADAALDGGRVGIMGGSYGGYLTAWTIAHDRRFAAAIVERGFLDPEGFIGTSDIGAFFGDEYVGTDAAGMAAQSPQAVVAQVSTPTLVIHSEDDLRCPVGQGERYHAALVRQGTESELLLFPGENHELTRAGRPRHRQQRFDAVLEWWARHLPVRDR